MSHTLSALGLPIKRWLDDVCWHALAADFDLDGGAEFRKACRHIAQPDALLEKRREISAGDIANGIRGRGVEDSESVARHGFSTSSKATNRRATPVFFCARSTWLPMNSPFWKL